MSLDEFTSSERMTTVLEVCRECDLKRLVTLSEHCFHSWEMVFSNTAGLPNASTQIATTTVEICRDCGLQRRVVMTSEVEKPTPVEMEIEFSKVDLP